MKKMKMTINFKNGKVVKSICDNYVIINGFLKIESDGRTGFFNTSELLAFEVTELKEEKKEIEEKK